MRKEITDEMEKRRLKWIFFLLRKFIKFKEGNMGKKDKFSWLISLKKFGQGFGCTAIAGIILFFVYRGKLSADIYEETKELALMLGGILGVFAGLINEIRNMIEFLVKRKNK